jgi:cytochrome c oxidase subunit 3
MTTEAASLHGHGHVAHHEPAAMERGMAGMIFFIASEIMLFSGLFAAYFFVRIQADVWPPEGTHAVDAGLGGVLTVILLLSGVFAHFGVVKAKQGDSKALSTMLIIAIVLGTIFIVGQCYEWLQLMDEGLAASSNVYGGTFYLLTGFHGAHVIAGLLLLAVAFGRALMGDFTPKRFVIVETSVLYWHFVDVVWVFLFGILDLT